LKQEEFGKKCYNQLKEIGKNIGVEE